MIGRRDEILIERVQTCKQIGNSAVRTCDNNRQSREIATENRMRNCIVSGVTSPHLHCRFLDRCAAALPTIRSRVQSRAHTQEIIITVVKCSSDSVQLFDFLCTEWFVRATSARLRVRISNIVFFFFPPKYLLRFRNNY